MKKHLLALAALATVSGVAAAQSVTAYGTLDVGLTSANRYTAGGSATSGSQAAAAGTLTSMNSGGIAPSVFGFKGTEDLGGGLKASFALESHLNSDAGSKETLSTGSNGLFARQANLSLSSASLGTLTLGRQFTPAVLAFAATDPRGLRESYSGLAIFGATAPTTNTTSHAGIFASNAVAYNISSGAFSFGALHGFGETAGDSGKNTIESFGLTYAGPVTVSAGYETSNNLSNSSGDTEKYTLGAGYKFGALNVKATSIQYKVKSSGAKTEIFGFGGEYAVSANSNLTAGFYHGKAKATGGKADSFVTSYEYSLSKRTTAYVQYALVDQGATATSANILGQYTVADKQATAFNIGLKHSF